jgi:16S rRNA processing protein RimM
MPQKKTLSLRNENSGSRTSSEPEFLAVGKLRRPHGVGGEILMTVWTEFPERLKPGVEIFIGDDHTPVCIKRVRWHRDDLLITFDGYPSREEVGLLRNQVMMVRAESLPPLEEGELYLHQIIGMTILDDEQGIPLGVVSEIIETGANDVYVVRDEYGSEFLLPAIDSVILDIDVQHKLIRVHLLPGLLPGKS